MFESPVTSRRFVGLDSRRPGGRRSIRLDGGLTEGELDGAPSLSDAPTGPDAATVYFKEDPAVGLAHLVVQSVESGVQGLVSKSRGGGLVTEYVDRSVHTQIVGRSILPA